MLTHYAPVEDIPDNLVTSPPTHRAGNRMIQCGSCGLWHEMSTGGSSISRMVCTCGTEVWRVELVGEQVAPLSAILGPEPGCVRGHVACIPLQTPTCASHGHGAFRPWCPGCRGCAS